MRVCKLVSSYTPDTNITYVGHSNISVQQQRPCAALVPLLVGNSLLTLKALTSWWGRLEMKPTVSLRIASRPEGRCTLRKAGSRVANSLHAQ